jgi:hypothetical protein
MPMGGGNNNFAGMGSLNNAWAVLDASPFFGSRRCMAGRLK